MRYKFLTAAFLTYISCIAETPIDSMADKTLDEVIVSATGANRNLKAAEMGRHVIGKDPHSDCEGNCARRQRQGPLKGF